MSPFAPPPKSMPLTEAFSAGEPEMSNAWYTWALNISEAVGGASGTVALAKITVSGTDGSLTFINGRITAFTQPT